MDGVWLCLCVYFGAFYGVLQAILLKSKSLYFLVTPLQVFLFLLLLLLLLLLELLEGVGQFVMLCSKELAVAL